jgi:hypothetical protein
MMAVGVLTVRVHVAWWVLPYIHTCAIFAHLFGTTPDTDKILATIMRGLEVRLT